MSLLVLIGLSVLGLVVGIRGGILACKPLISTNLVARSGALPLIGVVLCMANLLSGDATALPVPIGYFGGNGGVALDPLSCLFLLLAFVVAAYADRDPVRTRLEHGWRDLCLAATLLTMLAGDAFLLACGAILTILTLGRCAGGRFSRWQIVSGLGLVGACTLLSQISSSGGSLLADPGYALLRADGGIGRYGFDLLLPGLVLVAVVPLLGLSPAQSRFRRLFDGAPAWVPIQGILLGLFLLIRLLLDLAGPVPSQSWGAAVMALGFGSAFRSGLASLSGRRLCGSVGDLVALQTGLATGAVGLCLLAKADDLPILVAGAFDSVLLLTPVLSLGGLAVLGLARTMEREAGSGLLSRLGGLARSMPHACLMVSPGLAMLGFVPPAGGFAGLWLLLQSGLASQLPTLAGTPMLSGLLVAAVALSAGLAGAGWLRLIWCVGLGRPRTPRCAAATDAGPVALRLHGAPLLLPILSGLLPGLWLRLGNGAGLAALGPDGITHPLFRLVAPGGTTMLAPIPVAVAIGLALVLVVQAGRRFTDLEEHRAPAWEGGGFPPPNWLPFGDPTTQIGPATLALAAGQVLGPTFDHARRDASRSARVHRLRQVLSQARRASSRLGELLQDRGEPLALIGVAMMLLAVALGLLRT